MSSIASLYNVPSTQEELDTWAFCHASHHVDINHALYLQANIAMPAFILNPLNLQDAETWLNQHQELHQIQDGILGISGYDLLDVDFKDKNEFAGWVFINADEHKQASDILRIG